MTRQVIWSLLLFTFWLPASSKAVTVAEAGKAKAGIVIFQADSRQLLSAAETLQEYIEKSTGAKLSILSKPVGNLPEGQTLARILLCTKGYCQNPTLDLENLGEDGFLISVEDNGDIYIAGITEWGVRFGVYAFLERFLGIRWLLPGPDGVHFPVHEYLRVSVQEIRENPAFLQRNIGGLKGPAQATWGYRNGLHRTASYGHNLFRLLPPERYATTRPEFFPLIDNKRYSPLGDEKQRWQPCFSAPGIVEEAVKNICDFFVENPDQSFYSLSLNHGSIWCECEKCRLKDSGRINFLGFNDMSDRYFEWANQVAAGVLKRFPAKWFGCLAHKELAQAPSNVVVHPRIVPFMTYDGMKWVDPELERRGKSVMAEWTRKASLLGWYDYMYGTPYCVPRVYFHKMADYYRYAHSKGVRYMAAEAFPNWGEGPKFYLALKLQWNPYQDVDALLRDWCVAAVGRRGADYLAAFFELWENFWTKRILRGRWFSKEGAYLAFNNPGYLDLVTYDDIATSRRLLESVLEEAETVQQRARAKLLLRAFEYYEASVISYLGLVKKLPWEGKTGEFFAEMNKKRFTLVEEFEKDPVLVHPARFDKPEYKRLRWGQMAATKPVNEPQHSKQQ